MKKIILFIFIVLMQSLTVFCLNDNVGEIIGYVVEVHGDIVHIIGEPLTEDGFSDALIRLGNAPIYDLRTGFRVDVYDIEKDMDIRMAFKTSDAEPFSAMVVWLNWNDNDAAVFTVVASENINIGEDDAIFLSADGKYRVALTPETIILDPYSGILLPCDIAPGMEFFVWVDMITASTPALVYPDKVVVVY
ncbi:MAG: hypothetical protein FWE27_09545 [Defluviitaleaceae bacterium]|nr:hypothetical protein [Defluviitaleaceae bacterium]